MAITITDDQVRTIASKAILEGLSSEERDGLVQKALYDLLNVKEEHSNYYGTRVTPIQRMFAMEMNAVARGIITAFLAKPENLVPITAAVTTAVGKAISDETLIDRLADSIGKALVGNER